MPQQVPEKTLDQLGDQQRTIIEFIWNARQRRVTVRAVWEHLCRVGGRELAYTSVLSAMQKLERTGWLGHEGSSRQYRYHVRASQDHARSAALANLIETVFAGDRSAAIRHLFFGGTSGGGGQSTIPAKQRGALRSLVDIGRVVA